MQIAAPSLHPIIVNWITPEKVFLYEWEFWLVLFTAALAIVTFWLALETRGLRQDSVHSIKNAELQLKAMLQPIPELMFVTSSSGSGWHLNTESF
jgi:hypothetical protein